MTTLYLAHVGFYDQEIGIYELHSNILVVAEDIKSAREAIKQKEIYQSKNMHIDGMIEISTVDGYNVILEKQKCDSLNRAFGYAEVKTLG